MLPFSMSSRQKNHHMWMCFASQLKDGLVESWMVAVLPEKTRLGDRKSVV